MWPCTVTVVDAHSSGKLFKEVHYSPVLTFDEQKQQLTIQEDHRSETFSRVKVHSLTPTGIKLAALVPPISGHGFAPDEVHITLDFASE